MWILSLIVFWAIVWWLAGLFINKPWGITINIVLWIIWSLLGGFIMNYFGFEGITWFNLYSILVWVLWSVIVVAIARLFK